MKTAPGPVASMRHTIVLVLIFTFLAVAGGYADRSGMVTGAALTTRQSLRLYVSALAIEWASMFYVWKGTRRRAHLADLIGGRWQRPADVLFDVALAAGLWALWLAIQSVLPGSHGAASLLPQHAVEKAVWVLVALSAGFCEELVFRGYLQRQFHAFTGSLAAAIALQAFVFGIGHFYEGPWAVAKIVIYGALFGALTAWRQSLRPGMLAHVWSDLFGVVIWR
jgi:membrane protease YdiL (CAAX protease family)